MGVLVSNHYQKKGLPDHPVVLFIDYMLLMIIQLQLRT